MIVIIYNPEIYKEYLLPEETSTDYSMRMDRRVFGLRQDVELYFSGTAEGWKLIQAGSYTMTRQGEPLTEWLLRDGDILNIAAVGGEYFQIIVTDFKFSFPDIQKYDLKAINYITVGKAENNMIQYNFQNLISSNHAVLERRTDGFYVQDTSANGIFYRNRRIHGGMRLQFGDSIDIFGLHIVYLENVMAVGTSYGEAQVMDGQLWACPDIEDPYSGYEEINVEEHYFNRSPRNIPEIISDSVTIEGPPTPKQTKEKPLFMTIGPSFTMAIPMLLGCSMAILGSRLSGGSSSAFMFTGVITAISSAILGVFWAVTNLRYTKREKQEEEQTRFNAYGNYLIQITSELKEKYAQNEKALYEMYPSAAEDCSWTYSSVLWNRNFTHDDFLFVRLGIGDMPFQVEIEIPKEKFTLMNDSLQEKPRMIQEEYRMLKNVPVGLDLRKYSLIGLVGGKKKKGSVKLMQLIAASVAANNCYTDVKMAFVFNRRTTPSPEEWECMKWLPHVWSEDRTVRFLAGDETERGDVFFALTNILRVRNERAGGFGKKDRVKPYYLLFIEDSSILEGEMIRKYLLEPKEEYGIITFLMAETVEQLPNDCEDIIQNDEFYQGFYHVMQIGKGRQDIRFDDISGRQIEQFGRNICGLRVHEPESHADIPSNLDFMQMYRIHKLDEMNVEERWRKNRTYNSMKALVGRKLGDADCYLDIHEKFHGPHGLVAGTTGSGKSEALQTFMLSLAINFSPDDLAFFIIDFKGGGMANLFSDLPHMAGQISNLSGNQVRRAMISIKSENMRRQKIFSDYGVNNINLYTRLYKNHEATIPVPHLLIIIDEFAELKREEPDFMRELISVAQVGRSLGVHLILATQKPSGTVDDSIWSNSKFRLCLRVQDRQDSNDMLHKPDAAFITQAGRCYLQVGNDELYELFQSGYSGAPYYEDEESNPEPAATMLTTTGKTAVVINRKRRSPQAVDGKTKEKTQLDATVEYLRKIAVGNGYHYHMQLWLPVLPEVLYLESLNGYQTELYDGAGYPKQTGKWHLSTVIGLYDDPENQRQDALKVDFAENGHYAVCGTVVSGKSTFLQSLLYSMIMHYSPEYLNLYILDFSSRMLAPFEEAPHTGGILYENDTDKIGKLFHLLRGFMDERKQLFHGGNYSQYVQANGVTLPAILVVIDNFAGFKEKTANLYEEDLIRLSREGVGYGMYLLITAAGFGISEIQNRIGDNIRTVISLEMSDKYHYMDVLHTTHIPVLPESGVKGRGLALVDGDLLEFQTALSVKAEDDFSRSEKLKAICGRMSERWSGVRAKKIPMIPEKPILGQLVQREEYALLNRTSLGLPFAYKLEDASVYSVNLSATYCYGIYGRRRTGKTNVLRLLVHAASLQDSEIHILEPGGSELEKCAADYQVNYYQTPQEIFTYFQKLTPIFVERNKRKQELLKQGASDEMIYQEMIRQFRPIYLFVADLAEFIRVAYRKNEGILPMNGFLENIVEKGSLHNIYWISCMNSDEASALGAYKLYTCFTGYRTGVHLGGNLAAQRIFAFQNIPYAELNKSDKKGVGYVPDSEDDTIAEKVVIPLAVQ